jgi:hypothetical protein
LSEDFMVSCLPLVWEINPAILQGGHQFIVR